MVKVITAMEARQRLGQIMNEVQLRNDHYIIERAGKPIVAVVPLEEYKSWIGSREAFFEQIGRIQEKNGGANPGEIEAEIEEAVTAVRGARTSR